MATYVVQRGDTLWRIAQQFGTTTRDLIDRNSTINPDLIMPGQILQVPGAANEPHADNGTSPEAPAAGAEYLVDADIGLKVRHAPAGEEAGSLPNAARVVATGEATQTVGGYTWLHIQAAAY